jgi:hypothetical protein
MAVVMVDLVVEISEDMEAVDTEAVDTEASAD